MQGANGAIRSYVYFLTLPDYLTYQSHLASMAASLNAALKPPNPVCRIDVEQLLWGWV
jgi:hypothetical protein